ncbi:hypothetical protein A9K55_002801 [Cordyceps militaris]|uniref:Uncharacterized protein n=1 Tax=Cordyceps militaris TaxID=73501 RepID=A0A2H4S6C3_CORMI|nr:hypothetical protein A9K55_002801 [Cordyceps militaris]
MPTLSNMARGHAFRRHREDASLVRASPSNSFSATLLKLSNGATRADTSPTTLVSQPVYFATAAYLVNFVQAESHTGLVPTAFSLHLPVANQERFISRTAASHRQIHNSCRNTMLEWARAVAPPACGRACLRQPYIFPGAAVGAVAATVFGRKIASQVAVGVWLISGISGILVHDINRFQGQRHAFAVLSVLPDLEEAPSDLLLSLYIRRSERPRQQLPPSDIVLMPNVYNSLLGSCEASGTTVPAGYPIKLGAIHGRKADGLCNCYPAQTTLAQSCALHGNSKKKTGCRTAPPGVGLTVTSCVNNSQRFARGLAEPCLKDGGAYACSGEHVLFQEV